MRLLKVTFIVLHRTGNCCQRTLAREGGWGAHKNKPASASKLSAKPFNSSWGENLQRRLPSGSGCSKKRRLCVSAQLGKDFPEVHPHSNAAGTSALKRANRFRPGDLPEPLDDCIFGHFSKLCQAKCPIFSPVCGQFCRVLGFQSQPPRGLITQNEHFHQ